MKQTTVAVGTRFGQLVVLDFRHGRFVRGRRVRSKCRCRCDCGRIRVVTAANLLRVNPTRSCGCLRRAVAAQALTTHGLSHLPEYQLWVQIIDRCTNSKNPAWNNYGGRGITICPEWRHDFPAFLAAIGRRPNRRLVLDRENNDRGYEPGNVRWVTRTISAQNRRIPRPTHCKNGHEFTPANTKRHRLGHRICCQCQRDFAAKYRRRVLNSHSD